MDFFSLYLLVLIPNIDNFIHAASVISLILSVVLVFAVLFARSEYISDKRSWIDNKRPGYNLYSEYRIRAQASKTFFYSFNYYLKISMSVLIVSTVISIFVPSEEQLYKLIGGYFVTNIEGVGDLPPMIVEAAKNFLEQFKQ